MPISQDEDIATKLQDGVLLAKIAKKLEPTLVKKIFEHSILQYKHTDNIYYFLQVIKKIGLKSNYFFEPIDLYAKKDIPKVIYCIHALGHLLYKKKKGPKMSSLIGYLDFSEKQLKISKEELEGSNFDLPSFFSIGTDMKASTPDLTLPLDQKKGLKKKLQKVNPFFSSKKKVSPVSNIRYKSPISKTVNLPYKDISTTTSKSLISTLNNRALNSTNKLNSIKYQEHQYNTGYIMRIDEYKSTSNKKKKKRPLIIHNVQMLSPSTVLLPELPPDFDKDLVDDVNDIGKQEELSGTTISKNQSYNASNAMKEDFSCYKKVKEDFSSYTKGKEHFTNYQKSKVDLLNSLKVSSDKKQPSISPILKHASIKSTHNTKPYTKSKNLNIQDNMDKIRPKRINHKTSLKINAINEDAYEAKSLSKRTQKRYEEFKTNSLKLTGESMMEFQNISDVSLKTYQVRNQEAEKVKSKATSKLTSIDSQKPLQSRVSTRKQASDINYRSNLMKNKDNIRAQSDNSYLIQNESTSSISSKIRAYMEDHKLNEDQYKNTIFESNFLDQDQVSDQKLSIVYPSSNNLSRGSIYKADSYDKFSTKDSGKKLVEIIQEKEQPIKPTISGRVALERDSFIPYSTSSIKSTCEEADDNVPLAKINPSFSSANIKFNQPKEVSSHPLEQRSKSNTTINQVRSSSFSKNEARATNVPSFISFEQTKFQPINRPNSIATKPLVLTGSKDLAKKKKLVLKKVTKERPKSMFVESTQPKQYSTKEIQVTPTLQLQPIKVKIEDPCINNTMMMLERFSQDDDYLITRKIDELKSEFEQFSKQISKDSLTFTETSTDGVKGLDEKKSFKEAFVSCKSFIDEKPQHVDQITSVNQTIDISNDCSIDEIQESKTLIETKSLAEKSKVGKKLDNLVPFQKIDQVNDVVVQQAKLDLNGVSVKNRINIFENKATNPVQNSYSKTNKSSVFKTKLESSKTENSKPATKVEEDQFYTPNSTLNSLSLKKIVQSKVKVKSPVMRTKKSPIFKIKELTGVKELKAQFENSTSIMVNRATLKSMKQNLKPINKSSNEQSSKGFVDLRERRPSAKSVMDKLSQDQYSKLLEDTMNPNNKSTQEMNKKPSHESRYPDQASLVDYYSSSDEQSPSHKINENNLFDLFVAGKDKKLDIFDDVIEYASSFDLQPPSVKKSFPPSLKLKAHISDRPRSIMKNVTIKSPDTSIENDLGIRERKNSVLLESDYSSEDLMIQKPLPQLKPDEKQIRKFQLGIKGYLTRKYFSEVLSWLNQLIPRIQKLQAQIRGIEARKLVEYKVQDRLIERSLDIQPLIMQLQAQLRGVRTRNELEATLLEARVKSLGFFTGIINLQAMIKRVIVQRKWTSILNTINSLEFTNVLTRFQGSIRGGLVRGYYRNLMRDLLDSNILSSSSSHPLTQIPSVQSTGSCLFYYSQLGGENKAFITPSIQNDLLLQPTESVYSVNSSSVPLVNPNLERLTQCRNNKMEPTKSYETIIRFQNTYWANQPPIHHNSPLPKIPNQQIQTSTPIMQSHNTTNQTQNQQDYGQRTTSMMPLSNDVSNHERRTTSLMPDRSTTEIDSSRLVTPEISDEPSASVMRYYIDYLEETEADLKLELQNQQLRKQIINKIRNLYSEELELNQLDIKIGLLVKNKINIHELLNSVKTIDKLQRSNSSLNNSSVWALKSLDKENRRKLDLYQELFYLLQTTPYYLAKLMKLINTTENTHSMEHKRLFETIVLSIYGFAQNKREEFLLLKLFKESIKIELKDLVNIEEFLKSNPVFIKLAVHYNRGPKEQVYLRNLLNPIIMDIINDDEIDLQTNPLLIYRNLIKLEEMRTGEKSLRPYDVSAEQALNDNETRTVLIKHLQQLRLITDTFIAGIYASLDSMPYGIRYIAKELHTQLSVKFPHENANTITKVVGHLVYYRYINPAIIAPESFGIIDVEISPHIRRCLAEVAKMLNQVSMGKLFNEENLFLQPLNNFVLYTSEKFLDFILQITAILQPQAQLGVSELMELAQVQKPTIYISPFEICELHKMLIEHQDQLHLTDATTHQLASPNTTTSSYGDEEDPLLVLLRELDLPPNISQADNLAEISLILNPRFTTQIPESYPNNDVRIKGLLKELFLETKRLTSYILRIQTGDTLLDIMELSITEREESLYQSINSSSTSDQPDGEQGLTFSDLKRKTFSLLLRLEEAGLVTRDDGFQFIINCLAQDIKTKSTHFSSLRMLSKELKLTLVNLDIKQAYLDSKHGIYKEYLVKCYESYTSNQSIKKKKHFRFLLPFSNQYYHIQSLKKLNKLPLHGSIKENAYKLYQKGILISVLEYKDVQLKLIDLTIGSNEVGLFEIFVYVNRISITLEVPFLVSLDDLLQAQFDGLRTMLLFEGKVKVNVHLLLYFINKKFFV